jgi:putative toxin-antitoxin system antitoxin component (TIGR02293 family)
MVETFSIIRPNIPFEKWSLVDVLPVVGAVKQGFTMVEGENVRDAMGLPKTDFFRVVGLSARTAQRRQKDEKVLDVVSSDRIWRLANILAIATLVFKDREKARSWLHRSQPGLSGERPVDLLETEKGAGAVEDLLNAIRYGNYV